MGLVMPLVAYISGRGANAEDPGTPYNIQKRAFLAGARDALQRFYDYVLEQEAGKGSPGQTVMRRNHEGPDVVFETDRGERPQLQGLLGRCTIVAAYPSDLCRDREERTHNELLVFRDLVNDMSPVFLVPGFRPTGYANPFQKKAPGLYTAGLSLMKRVRSEAYRDYKPGDLSDFVGDVMGYTIEIRSRSQESAKRTA